MRAAVSEQEAFDALVDRWRNLQRNTDTEQWDAVAAWSDLLDRLRRTQEALAIEGRWTSGPSNLMAVLNLTRAEVANCRVVRWLFDPLARHGIATRLLTDLCRELGVSLEGPMLVRAEAEVAIENTRADIVLSGTRAGASIVIEAKVDAGEQPGQGARLEELWPSADVYVFLTTGGTRVPHTLSDRARWRSLSWGWIADAAAVALATTPEPADLRARDSRAAVAAWVTSAMSNLT